MASICSYCGYPIIAETVYNTCSCCDKLFHIQCTQLPATLANEVRRRIDLHWSCSRCTTVLNMPHSMPLTAALRAVQPQTEASQRIHSSVNNSQLSQKRHTTVTATSAPSFPRTIIGTNLNCTALPVAHKSCPPASSRAWLHLSGLDNSVTSEHVTSAVASLLGSDDIIVFSLLRKGDDAATVRSLSFKVGIPGTLRAKAFLPNTWPLGLQVREFVCGSASSITLPPSSGMDEPGLKQQCQSQPVAARAVRMPRTARRKEAPREIAANQPTLERFFLTQARHDAVNDKD
ncbi:uncharacterized protein LOC120894012 [Anopheles arabiensis]|uniref:uncharacterized protein LOC120894012 n=1 Tax=Anopheles arabiensis TaxID=7173 RepID=UPI001AACF60A|nr:uncharacterized protein LOC120894012 [Anopheles arabiensis]XP_040152265.1 uncharacterized protein LOC120894012 [Anopheles arabiensis]XP_040152266.1 uncharacterized protein LOC120894012 [Anopheles arabiensis]